MSDTTIRWERNAMMSAAHLMADDGGRAYVFCSIPGGRPWLALSPDGSPVISITDAPQCETDREFRTFVIQRFGDDA